MYGLDLVIVIDGIPVGVTRFGRKETLLVDFITKESQHQTETGKRTYFWLQKDILWYSENMVHINGKFYLNLSKGYDNNMIPSFCTLLSHWVFSSANNSFIPWNYETQLEKVVI